MNFQFRFVSFYKNSMLMEASYIESFFFLKETRLHRVLVNCDKSQHIKHDLHHCKFQKDDDSVCGTIYT